MHIKNQLFSALVGCAVLAGCANGDEPSRVSERAPGPQADVSAGGAVRDVQLVRVGDDPAQEASRLKRFGQLLLGRTADEQTLDRWVRTGTPGAPGQTRDDRAGLPLRVMRLPHNDDTLVVNRAVSTDRSDCEDVGEEGARAAFERAVEGLRAQGAPEAEGLDLTQVHVARLSQGAGKLGEPSTMRTRVQQYIFSAPRVVDDIVISDSSLSVGVHRSGALASIRSTGMLATPRADARRGTLRSRRTSSAELEERVQREFPGSEAHSLGLRYIGTLRAATDAEGVAPHEVYLVFPPLQGTEGRSRGVRVAYSVTDPGAPSIYLDKPSANDHGDRRL